MNLFNFSVPRVTSMANSFGGYPPRPPISRFSAISTAVRLRCGPDWTSTSLRHHRGRLVDRLPAGIQLVHLLDHLLAERRRPPRRSRQSSGSRRDRQTFDVDPCCVSSPVTGTERAGFVFEQHRVTWSITFHRCTPEPGRRQPSHSSSPAPWPPPSVHRFGGRHFHVSSREPAGGLLPPRPRQVAKRPADDVALNL